MVSSSSRTGPAEGLISLAREPRAQGLDARFAGVECSPCSFFGRRRCPRGHFRCMLDLDEERAWRALLPLLHAGPRAALHA